MQQRKPKLYVISHKNKPSYPTKSSKKKALKIFKCYKNSNCFHLIASKNGSKMGCFLKI